MTQYYNNNQPQQYGQPQQQAPLEQTQGVVADSSSKVTAKGTSYTIVVNGEKYGSFNKPIPCNIGDTVSFSFSRNQNFKNIKGNVVVLSAGNGQPPPQPMQQQAPQQYGQPPQQQPMAYQAPQAPKEDPTRTSIERQKSLDLAVQYEKESSSKEEVIATARLFYAFISGKADQQLKQQVEKEMSEQMAGMDDFDDEIAF